MHPDIEDRISHGALVVGRPAALRAALGYRTFASQCELGFLDNGFRCAQPAVAYVEFHMVGHCRRFDCDERGNACGFVCADHRDALECTAQDTAEETQPTALTRLLFKRTAQCPTCGRRLLTASDILQVMVSL
jgi:hypothetical protein